MSEITALRHRLKAAVGPILNKGEQITVAAAPSEYAGGLNTLRFSVSVSVGEPGEQAAERLDALLDPSGGVKAALEGAGGRVTKSSGHEVHQGPLLGATWTAEVLT